MHLALSLIAALLGAFVFSIWYDRLPRRRLSAAEIDSFLARMRAGRPDNRPEDVERFKRFQALGASDDGREFYMVNLIRYRKDAAGGERSALGVPKSHNDYMKAWGKVAIRRASHLIYRGRPAVKLFGAPDQTDWDMIAIMRYRSRRDLFEIVTDPVFARDAALKNVAVEYTDVYPSSVAYILASPRMLVFLVILPVALAASDWFL